MKPATTFLCSTVVGGLLLAQGLCAAEWQRETGITLSAYVSDNICLSNRDREVWAAGTATPDIYVRGSGARANLYLRTAVEYNTLAVSDLRCTSGQSGSRSSREPLIASLRYLGDLELIENWLTLESDAFVGVNPLDPFAAGEADNFNGRNNVNFTYQYGAGATLERRLFDHAEMRLRYRYNEQYNRATLLSDSNENRAEFDLGAVRGSSPVTLGVAGRYSRVNFAASETGPAFDNTLASAELWVALQPGSSWQINGLAGEDWNEFTSARPEIDGKYWDVGLRWTPNERVEVAFGYGERFFGRTPRMSIRYRHKRSELTLDYTRTLTFPRNLRTAGNVFDGPLDSIPGSDPAPGVDPGFGQLPGDPPRMSGELTFIGNTPIINERLALRYQISGRRTTITIVAANSRQLRTEDLVEATFSSLETTYSRSLSASLSAHLRLNWSEREAQSSTPGILGQYAQTWRAGLGFSRRIGTDTRVTLDYQHTRQESRSALNQYSENRVELSARHQF